MPLEQYSRICERMVWVTSILYVPFVCYTCTDVRPGVCFVSPAAKSSICFGVFRLPCGAHVLEKILVFKERVTDLFG